MKPPLQAFGHDVEILSLNKKGDGTHRVLKVNNKGTPAVLKCYGRTRGRFASLLKLCGIRLLVGKTSTSPRGRMATEQTVLTLLAREGFSVPKILPWGHEQRINQPVLALEWIEGLTLAEIVRSPQYSLETKRNLLFRCGVEMRQRHDRAINLFEPCLVFEHPSLHHVIVSNGKLVYIDFEITFCRTSDIERLARREIAGFLYSLARSQWTLFTPLFTAFIHGYAHPERIHCMLGDLRRYGTVPVVEWLTYIPFLFRIKQRHRRIASAARTLRITPEPQHNYSP